MPKYTQYTDQSRHRLSKEIAIDLLDEHGDGGGAHLHCVEKLTNNAANPQLWRDVLAWLDELNNDPANTRSLTKGENK
jgi:hypothetical protein